MLILYVGIFVFLFINFYKKVKIYSRLKCQEHNDNKVKFDSNTFREWQKNLIEIPLIRHQRISKSILESNVQKDIRKKFNRAQNNILLTIKKTVF